MSELSRDLRFYAGGDVVEVNSCISVPVVVIYDPVT